MNQLRHRFKWIYRYCSSYSPIVCETSTLSTSFVFLQKDEEAEMRGVQLVAICNPTTRCHDVLRAKPLTLFAVMSTRLLSSNRTDWYDDTNRRIRGCHPSMFSSVSYIYHSCVRQLFTSLGSCFSFPAQVTTHKRGGGKRTETPRQQSKPGEEPGRAEPRQQGKAPRDLLVIFW